MKAISTVISNITLVTDLKMCQIAALRQHRERIRITFGLAQAM